MINSFEKLVTTRQSVRKYKTTPVARELLIQCVEAVRLAPSACNAQPWKFILVTDESLKNEIANHAASLGMNKFCAQASAIAVVVLEKPNLTSKIGSVLQGKEYTLIDIGIAAEHFCLQATELGLGTCMVGWFNEKKIQRALKIPSSKRIPLFITIGYSDDEPREKNRKQFSEMCRENEY